MKIALHRSSVSTMIPFCAPRDHFALEMESATLLCAHRERINSKQVDRLVIVARLALLAQTLEWLRPYLVHLEWFAIPQAFQLQGNLVHLVITA